jgi:hypothetical protein
MFFSDGTLWGNIAEAQGVGGDQWGVMNELWIPVINRIPRWIPLYKIIYRQYYHSTEGGQPPARAPSEPATPPHPNSGNGGGP